MRVRSDKRKQIKNNLEYFWMYYKIPFSGILIVLLLALHFLFVSMTEKETALSVMLIDCHTEMSSEKMADSYMNAVGIDEKKYQVQMQTELMFQGTDSGNYTMTSLSRFMADIGSELLDVCAMQWEDFLKYDKSDTWSDLREYLTEEQSSMLEKFFVQTEDGRVIGLMADELPVLVSEGCYTNAETDAVIGIVYNSSHKEEAVRYLLYLAGMME